MKIISGKLKGRKIEGFDLDGTRPTMDRVKESLFAIIQDKIINSSCLDLFAGSGNLGIEAISQGANKVYFVDYNIKAIQTIKKNIKLLQIEEATNVIHKDFKVALSELYPLKFDIIFLDPPYHTKNIEIAICLITKYDILNDNGFIICESDSLEKIIYPNNYQEIKTRKYGSKYIVILKKI